MNKTEKIKAEIEKRMQELRPTNTHKMQVGGMDRDVLMWLNALTWVKKVIDSLEEEPVSNDLEKELDKYFSRFKGLEKCYWNWRIDSINIHAQGIYDFAKHFAQWQKEKMMEDAVDGEIYFNMDYLQYHINTEPLTHFHHGDKVKLIIIKEE